MAQPEIATDLPQLQALAQERADMENTVKTYREYKEVEKSIKETKAMLDDGLEEEMLELAQQEIESLETRQSELSEQLRMALLPKDPNDKKDIIMEGKI